MPIEVWKMYSKNEKAKANQLIYIENTKKQTLIKKTTTIYDVCLSNCNLISSLLDLFTHTYTHTSVLGTVQFDIRVHNVCSDL